MASIADRVFDNGLTVLNTEVDRLDICSQEPTTYTQAVTTYSLGNKLTPTISAPADRVGGGREVTASAISDGDVTATDTATHWALVDTGNSRLLATGSITTPQSVTSGNTFTLTSFAVGVTDPS
jgi:hypothetical protein